MTQKRIVLAVIVRLSTAVVIVILMMNLNLEDATIVH